MKKEKIGFEQFRDLLSPDEMKKIQGGTVYCMGIAYDEIVVKGACSGDSVSECMNYAWDMGLRNVSCQYEVQY